MLSFKSLASFGFYYRGITFAGTNTTSFANKRAACLDTVCPSSASIKNQQQLDPCIFANTRTAVRSFWMKPSNREQPVSDNCMSKSNVCSHSVDWYIPSYTTLVTTKHLCLGEQLLQRNLIRIHAVEQCQDTDTWLQLILWNIMCSIERSKDI